MEYLVSTFESFARYLYIVIRHAFKVFQLQICGATTEIKNDVDL